MASPLAGTDTELRGSVVSVSQSLEDPSADTIEETSPALLPEGDPSPQPDDTDFVMAGNASDECPCVRRNGPTLGHERHSLLTEAGLDCRTLFADQVEADPARLREEISRVLPRVLSSLGREVLRFRERLQLSQYELASQVAVDPDVVRRVEAGHGQYDEAVALIHGLEELLRD